MNAETGITVTGLVINVDAAKIEHKVTFVMAVANDIKSLIDPGSAAAVGAGPVVH